jgi:hypothetical protein
MICMFCGFFWYLLWNFLVHFVDVSIGIYVMVLDKIIDKNMFFLLPFVDVSIIFFFDKSWMFPLC